MRQTMILHNQYRWDRDRMRVIEVGKLARRRLRGRVPAAQRRSVQFIRRVKGGRRSPAGPAPPGRVSGAHRRPIRPSTCARASRCMPRLEALAVYKGERACTNDDLIRNAAYSWSPMTADRDRGQDRHPAAAVHRAGSRPHLAARRARPRWQGRDAGPRRSAPCIFCSCTSAKMMPSLATWLSGQLGMFQTHVSGDMVAACAGLPYGSREAIRLLQEVRAPGAGGVRREVLRQDRHRADLADDLRRRRRRPGGRARARRRARRRRVLPDLRRAGP